jgi:membrane-associated phospholipid phosphatase
MTGPRICFAATSNRCSGVAKAKASRAVLAADAAAAEAALPYQGSPAMEALGRFASLGDQPPLRTLCAATIAAGLAGGDRRLARAGLRMLLAHTLATLAKDFVKHRVDRARPRSRSRKGEDHVPRPGRRTAKEVTSFPSGHSAGAAAVARAFARDYPEHSTPAHAAAAALAFAQIPRCAHYPSDVGAGLAIGIAAEAVVDLGLRLVKERPSPDRQE